MDTQTEPIARRQGPDFWTKYVRVAGVVVWGFMLFIIVFLDRAKPRTMTFFDRLLNVDVPTHWDLYFLTIVLFISLAQLIFASLSLIINATRYRRKCDRISKSLIITTFISILIIVFSLIKLL